MARRSHHGRHSGRHRRPANGGAGGQAQQRPALDVAAAQQTPPPPVADTRPIELPIDPAIGAGLQPESGTAVPGPAGPAGATASQLRRFIRSRPYVPLHELRRRFALNGGADEMAAIEIDGQRLWVGLPPREGRLLGDLLRGGDIGYELSVDPVTPVIVGVYALKSIPRP